MFSGCSSLTHVNNISVINGNASYMFSNAFSSKLINLTHVNNISVINGNTSNMFRGCTNLTTLNNCIFRNINNASNMFRGCSSLTGYSNQILRDANGNYIDTHTDPGKRLYTFNNCVNLTDYNEIHANWK